jgi:transcriptional regulator with XRE-family HTH domain
MATRKKQAGGAWPLGKYLVEARGKMSIREAARRAGISESRWRQVEAGVQKMAGGIEVPVHPKAETIAAMCRAISADTRRGLELAGHDPAHYSWLLEPAVESMPDAVRHDWFQGLPREERERVLAELQRLHVDTEVKQQGRHAV